MDLRALRYFVGVAECGSFSRAAERLHTAQPNLSLQIQKLEAELGVRLFHRSRKGATATAAGERLLGHARAILTQAQAARDDLRTEAAEPIGPVVFGLPQSIAITLAVPVVREVIRRWPRVVLSVVDANTGDIPDRIRSGQFDLGLVFRAETGIDLRYNRLVEEELILVGPPGALAGRVSITIAEVSQLPLLLPSRRHSLREFIETCARRHNVSLDVVAEVDAMPQLRDLAMAGAGYSILAYASVRREVEAVRLDGSRIVEPVLRRSCFLCRSATLPPTRPVQAVEGLIREVAAELAAQGHWPTRPAG